MFRYILIFLLIFFNFSSLKSEENSLTLKQQLERLQRDFNDMSQLVYKNNVRDIEDKKTLDNTVNISAFDMRIYDLEQDIKNLNSNFEELTFQIDEFNNQIDEFKNLFEELSIKIDSVIIANNETMQNIEKDSSETKDEDEVLPENTLGTLKINSEDLSTNDANNEQNTIETISQNLTPEEEYQIAFELLRLQKFDQANEALKVFISNNSESNLSGSAHYWLGELHLLKEEYRKAALIFAEGYQKYPSSIKAPNSLYKLAEALIKIDKKNEACNTLTKFQKEHTKHKLIDKTNIKINELECENLLNVNSTN